MNALCCVLIDDLERNEVNDGEYSSWAIGHCCLHRRRYAAISKLDQGKDCVSGLSYMHRATCFLPSRPS